MRTGGACTTQWRKLTTYSRPWTLSAHTAEKQTKTKPRRHWRKLFSWDAQTITTACQSAWVTSSIWVYSSWRSTSHPLQSAEKVTDVKPICQPSRDWVYFEERKGIHVLAYEYRAQRQHISKCDIRCSLGSKQAKETLISHDFPDCYGQRLLLTYLNLSLRRKGSHWVHRGHIAGIMAVQLGACLTRLLAFCSVKLTLLSLVNFLIIQNNCGGS